MAMLSIDFKGRELPDLQEDVFLTTNEAGALLDITAPDKLSDFCKVFGRSGTNKSSVKTAVLTKLSEREYVTGNIANGRIAWNITPLGARIVVAVESMLEIINNEIEDKKKSFAKSDFEEKVRNNYYSIDSTTAQKFSTDLFTHFGVSENPKAGKAYQIAWDHGHACGYQEVVHYFAELVELIE